LFFFLYLFTKRYVRDNIEGIDIALPSELPKEIDMGNHIYVFYAIDCLLENGADPYLKNNDGLDCTFFDVWNDYLLYKNPTKKVNKSTWLHFPV